MQKTRAFQPGSNFNIASRQFIHTVATRIRPARPIRVFGNVIRDLEKLRRLRHQRHIAAPRCVGPESFTATVAPAELRNLRRNTLVDLRVIAPGSTSLPQDSGLDRGFSPLEAARKSRLQLCLQGQRKLVYCSLESFLATSPRRIRKLFIKCQRQSRRLRGHGRIACTHMIHMAVEPKRKY